MLFRGQLLVVSLSLIFSAASYCADKTNKQSSLTQPFVLVQPLTTEPVNAFADTEQCVLTAYEKITHNFTAITDQSIRIEANSSSIKENQLALFNGEVMLVNKDHTILADQLAFNRETLALLAQGNIHYQNQGIDIFAAHLNVSQSSQKTTLAETAYQLADSPGHGSARELSISADGSLSLIDSTYTTCVGDVPDWQIKASEITISTADNIGQIYGAQIRVFDVPVLYLPYFSFPVTDERKSGFLYPSFKTSSQSGLEVTTPFYWNIADNLDATLTPHYMSKRGTQWRTELRYLFGEQSGIVDIEYLTKDDEVKANDDPRYLARFQHIGTFSTNFRAYIDFTTISDDNYLLDIGSTQYNYNDSYLYQVGELSYFGEGWQTTMKIQDFEVLGDHQASYKTLPQIQFQLYQPVNYLNTQFELYSEFSRFESTDNAQVNANRYHIEAGFSLPFSSPAWFLNSELKLLHTYYQQENMQLGSQLAENVSRTLPKVRLHGGLNLDRAMSLFNAQYTQTLEPQVQYLYVGEVDQSNIGIYDSSTLQDDYDGLFRDRRNSGLDRIAATNQYSWGLTSRVLDAKNTELVRFSLGRITYLDNFDSLDDNDKVVKESALAADLFFRLNHQWQISSGLQLNTKSNQVNKSQINLDYRFTKNTQIQLNHRFTRDVSGNRLEQASLVANFPLSKDWKFVGRTTQDLIENRRLETYVGLQYESCCWAIRLVHHRHIISNFVNEDFLNENRDEFDSGFMVEFVIKGLNGQQSNIGTEDMFNSSIFGFKRPYFLNN
jgi:LPS-assembly protein